MSLRSVVAFLKDAKIRSLEMYATLDEFNKEQNPDMLGNSGSENEN